MFLLTETTTATVGDQITNITNNASTFVDALLGMGTKIFNWAMSNPIFVIAILIMLVMVVIGIVKSFSHR